MKSVFADAGFWIAYLAPRDSLHKKARSVFASLGSVRVVTSEMVLTEFLNDLAGRGQGSRKAAIAFVERLRRRLDISIIPQSSIQFQGAFSLYASRNDKSWGLTDCASFCIMDDLGLTEALSHDRHFEQAGFKPLLR